MDPNPQREMELSPVTVESSGVGFFLFVFVCFFTGEDIKSEKHITRFPLFFKLGLLAVFCNNIFNQCPLFPQCRLTFSLVQRWLKTSVLTYSFQNMESTNLSPVLIQSQIKSTTVCLNHRQTSVTTTIYWSLAAFKTKC